MASGGAIDGAPIHIRPVTGADAAACVALGGTVGWPGDEEKWRMMLGVGEGIGAERNGELAGAVIVNRFGAAVATVAMMVVRADLQRAGVGRRLMEEVIARTRGASVTYLYASEAGRPLYARLGFVARDESLRVEGCARASTAAAPPGLRRLGKGDIAGVEALDCEAQGAPRRALLEATLGTSAAALVIERAGTIAAFGAAWCIHGTRVLGPIVAREDGDARALAAALAAEASEPLRLDLEPGERALLAWAWEVGLAVVGPTPRMVLEARELPGRRALVRALASRAYG